MTIHSRNPLPDTEYDLTTNAIVQPAVSGPDMRTDALHRTLVLACYRANHQIWLVIPCFLPTPALLDALASAAHRGIQVGIVIPDRS